MPTNFGARLTLCSFNLVGIHGRLDIALVLEEDGPKHFRGLIWVKWVRKNIPVKITTC